DHDLGKAGLVDRDLTVQKRFDLGFIDIDADDTVPVLGETSGGDKADITRADDTNFHAFCGFLGKNPSPIPWAREPGRLGRMELGSLAKGPTCQSPLEGPQ